MNDMLWKEIKQKHINTHLKPEKVEKGVERRNRANSMNKKVGTY